MAEFGPRHRLQGSRILCIFTYMPCCLCLRIAPLSGLLVISTTPNTPPTFFCNAFAFSARPFAFVVRILLNINRRERERERRRKRGRHVLSIVFGFFHLLLHLEIFWCLVPLNDYLPLQIQAKKSIHGGDLDCVPWKTHFRASTTPGFELPHLAGVFGCLRCDFVALGVTAIWYVCPPIIKDPAKSWNFFTCVQCSERSIKTCASLRMVQFIIWLCEIDEDTGFKALEGIVIFTCVAVASIVTSVLADMLDLGGQLPSNPAGRLSLLLGWLLRA